MDLPAREFVAVSRDKVWNAPRDVLFIFYRKKFVEMYGISAGANDRCINFNAAGIDSDPLAICLDRDNAEAKIAYPRATRRNYPFHAPFEDRPVSLLIYIRASSSTRIYRGIASAPQLRILMVVA